MYIDIKQWQIKQKQLEYQIKSTTSIEKEKELYAKMQAEFQRKQDVFNAELKKIRSSIRRGTIFYKILCIIICTLVCPIPFIIKIEQPRADIFRFLSIIVFFSLILALLSGSRKAEKEQKEALTIKYKYEILLSLYVEYEKTLVGAR